MKLARPLAFLALSTALAGSQASAADYFVKAITPGVVTGTPLAVITLQGGGDNREAASALKQQLLATSTEQIRGETPVVTERAGKWVAARKGKTSGGTAESESTGGEGTGTTETGGGGSAPSEGSGSTSGGTTTPGTTTPGTTTPGTTTPGTTTPGTTAPTTGGTTAGSGPLTAPSSTTGAAMPPGAQAWANFDALMKSGKVTGGDRIFLLGGYHGQLLVRDKKFTSTVTVAPAAGAVAHADSILVMNSSNVHIQGLKVWPRTSGTSSQALVRSYTNTSNIAFTDLDVRSIATAGNYASWTMADWTNNQRSAILIDGANATAARNRVTGIFHGVHGAGPNALIEDNIVDGFSGDGLRALGDGTVVRRNKVQNCRQINGNHADGLQSWSRGPGGKPGTGTIRNVTIEDNKIIEYVGTRSPFACKLQGIGMFDGFYENFVIRNNVISSTAFHGITMGGGINSLIVNNTVIHAGGLAGNFPWIRVANKKDGSPSRNVTVANNLVTSNKVVDDAQKNIVETNNVTIVNSGADFMSVVNRNFALRSGSKAIDAGTATLAPKDDIVGTARPKGKAPDAGAYENF